VPVFATALSCVAFGDVRRDRYDGPTKLRRQAESLIGGKLA
jgi:hypothetical protein